MSHLARSSRSLAVLVLTGLIGLPAAAQQLDLDPLGTYTTGIFDDAAAEIVDYDPTTMRAFVVNGADNAIDALDISDPTNPTKVFSIDLSPWGAQGNSVAVCDGLLAVGIEADPKQDPGTVAFFDTAGNALGDATVGALPDMVVFTPGCDYVLSADEGEPNDDYDNDPQGTVSIVKVADVTSRSSSRLAVKTVKFTQFNGNAPEGVRIFGPGASVAQDLEPEYIAISPDGSTAYVSLQENNALAVIDIATATVTALRALGLKDHGKGSNAFDASNEDGRIRIKRWPTMGMYQPDAIAAVEMKGNVYVISANEGDARDYDGYSEEARVQDLDLDPSVFTKNNLQDEDQLGRLNTTTANGDDDGNGLNEAIYSYGARSISIWDPNAGLVWDSGKTLEKEMAKAYRNEFNSNNDENDSFDSRSDDKGPEPEGLAVGEVNGRTYVFVGLERISAIAVFELRNNGKAKFVTMVDNRDFSGDAEAGTAGDLGPEGLKFVPASDSPTGDALLIVGNEVSGSTTIWRVR